MLVIFNKKIFKGRKKILNKIFVKKRSYFDV